ncbi:response regulator [Flavobacteriales bacterium]|jgi:two-component SAPR family response regulator|nr:response regulator [Flavobacteriales bacterium]
MEKEHVLLVDDDTMAIEALKRILSIYPNLQVHSVSTVCSAIKVIMDYDPKVIICDLILGKLNADDLYNTLQCYNIDDRFVFISGSTRNELSDDMLEVIKNKSFFNKPFTRKQIQEKVQMTLGLVV